jgi:predicted GNAT family N-acyltransferase
MKELVYKFADNDTEHEGMREVRRQVFVEEQGIPENLVFSGDLVDDENVVVVLDNQNIIGTARIVFSSENTAKIERMAVLKKYRNRGTGRKIMSFIISQVKNRGFSKVYLHAQHTAVEFYRSCGFRVVGTPFKEAGIQHIKMELDLFDIISSNTSNSLEYS